MTGIQAQDQNAAPMSIFSMTDQGGSARTNGKAHIGMTFQSAFGACNFVVTWNGEDVRDLLDAIRFARLTGDRFIQDKLIEYILNIPYRIPRPTDIPAFVGKPVWAVDRHERALVGMPGSETVVELSTLRQSLPSQKSDA